MTLNISLEIEQQQRIENDLVAVQAQIDRETDIHAEGKFDGVIGSEPNPDMWTNLNYRSGYLSGVAEFYDKKYQTVFTDEPFQIAVSHQLLAISFSRARLIANS